MTTELAVPQPAALSQQDYSREKIELIKRTIAKGATDDELDLFMEICNRRRMDPFAKQIYFVKGVGNIVSIDGMRANADRSGKYLPGPITYHDDSNGNVIYADATVRKFIQGEWHDVTERAYLSEFKLNTPNWNKGQHYMLAKCAEARALRRAFPEDTSGLYVAEEMSVDTSTGEVIDEVAKPAPPPKAKRKPTLNDYAAAAIRSLQEFGKTLPDLEAFLQRSRADWSEPEVRILHECYKSLKAGTKTVEELFAWRGEEPEDAVVL